MENSVKLNRVLHVPKMEHSLVLVPILFDDNHTVKLGNQNCVVKWNNSVAGIGEVTGGICIVNLQ